MKYLIKDINKNEKDRLEKMGLYCYDLRESDMGDEVANIEKNVFINKVGNMITNEKIEFEKSPNDFVNYFDFCMKNEQVDKIEDLLVREKLAKLPDAMKYYKKEKNRERQEFKLEVKINREIREYTESIFFGLSMRQFIFSALACGIAVLLYFVLKPYFRY